MFMLAFHIVAIGILVVMTWAIAHRRGVAAGERRLRRRLGLAAELEEGGETTRVGDVAAAGSDASQGAST